MHSDEVTITEATTETLKDLWAEAYDGFRSAIGASAEARGLFASVMTTIEDEMLVRGERVSDECDGWVAA